MSTKGQGHLGPNLSDSVFLNFFSSMTTWPIEARFHVKPPWNGGTKAPSNGPGHMTMMAAMPMYGENLLLWNLKMGDLETYYAPLST